MGSSPNNTVHQKGGGGLTVDVVRGDFGDETLSCIFRVCWWNGGGAIRERISVNPNLSLLFESKPDIFAYGEAQASNTRGLFLSGYRFLFHRSYLKDRLKNRRGLVVFYRKKYHNYISKVYASRNFDIIWIRLVTGSVPVYFCFFYAPGAPCSEDVRVGFYKCLSDS